MSDADLRRQILQSQRYIDERVLHPTTRMIYNNVDWEDPDRWARADFVPPEELARSEATGSRRANTDDCAMHGAIYLSALVDCYEVSGADEAVGQARRVFEGLTTVARVSERRGFIARGVHPADGSTHLLNSSVDQYTWYVYGLWRLYRSRLADEGQKAAVRQIMHEICDRIEQDGFDIRNTRGNPGWVSDIGVIRSDRSSRLLEVYLAGYDVTGNPHWLDIYREKVAENRHARLRSLVDAEGVLWPYTRRGALQADHAVLQTQVSLLPLFLLDTDIPVRACCLEALRLNALLMETRKNRGRIYQGWEGVTGLHVAVLAHGLSLVPSEHTPPLSDRAALLRERCRAVLAAAEPANEGAVALYWSAVRSGLFPA